TRCPRQRSARRDRDRASRPLPSSTPAPCSSPPLGGSSIRLAETLELGQLLVEVPGHLLVDILEHGLGAVMRTLAQDAVALCLGIGGAHLLLKFGGEPLVLLVTPFADQDQMRLQAFDRIA